MLVLTAMILAMASGAVGCAGKSYVNLTTLNDGTKVVQGGRTGVFGTDDSFVHVTPPTPPAIKAEEVKKVQLKRSYTRSVISWTGCPDKKPNPRAKNIKREEVAEESMEEVIVPPASAPAQAPAAFWAGGNPSVLNLGVPAAAIAGGMIGGAAALRPAQTNINATGNGGGGGLGGDAASSSSSSSAASAAAAAAAEAAAKGGRK